MFRKRYYLWRSLIYIVNMPFKSLEDSITGDATAVPFFKVFRKVLATIKSY